MGRKGTHGLTRYTSSCQGLQVTDWKKILICGLPRAGKTTLAQALVPLLNAVHFNADEVRLEINKDLGFSPKDRLEQARRMGWLCSLVTRTGCYAVADFVCPTRETRQAFGDAFVCYVDTPDENPWGDTGAMFEPAQTEANYIARTRDAAFHARNIVKWLKVEAYNTFDEQKPTALLLGRYQPFHEGHQALVREALERVGQVCIAVRDTFDLDDKNPYSFEQVKRRIRESLPNMEGRVAIISVPNIVEIFYGRDVGYKITEIVLSEELQGVSATKIREAMRKQP